MLRRFYLWLLRRKRECKALESYYELYGSMLREVREETCRKFPEETGMLVEFIDNWIELIPRDKQLLYMVINSLSGILLFYLWRLSNWVTYEILSGRYFEAIRNLRFLFEGSVYAVVIEDAIERRIYEKWKALSGIDLKTEIFMLWDECRRKRVKGKKGVDVDKVRKIVASFINQHADLSDPKRREYIEVYTQILSDERLYLPVSRMIDEALELLGLDQNFGERLGNVWRELSSYLHFSHAFLKAILKAPELLSLEAMNKELFKKSLNLYFETLDLYYAVLAWRFPRLRENIKRVVEWWKEAFNKTFNLTETFLKQQYVKEAK